MVALIAGAVVHERLASTLEVISNAARPCELSSCPSLAYTAFCLSAHNFRLQMHGSSAGLSSITLSDCVNGAHF